MDNETREKDTRSLVMKFFDYAQQLGVDEAVDRVMKTSKQADEWMFRKLMGWAGDRVHLKDEIESHFFRIGKNWAKWTDEVRMKSGKEHRHLISLKGGLQLCAHIYYRLSVAENEKTLLDELYRFKLNAWKVIERNGEVEVLEQLLLSDGSPVLEVLPPFVELGKKGVEQVVRGSSMELAEVGDGIYGELLRMVYRMVNFCETGLELPDSVSELVSVLPSFWENDLLIQFMMYEDLAIIIDSEKNGRTSFSPFKMEITFFNGEGKCLGPLKPREFSDLYDKYRKNLALIPFIPSFVQRQYMMDQITGIFT